MITKREVLSAIARCESLTGFGPLDRTTTHVERGDIAVLIEAAKCAKYTEGIQQRAVSESDWILDDREPAEVIDDDPDA